MKLSDYSIGTRLKVSFSILILFLCVVAVMGLNGLKEMESELDEIVNDNMAKLTHVNTMSENVHIVSRVVRSIVIINDPAKLEPEFKKITEARALYEEGEQAFLKLMDTEDEKKLMDQIHEAKLKTRELNNQVIELAKQNKDDEAAKLLLEVASPVSKQWQDGIDKMIALQEAMTVQDVKDAMALYHKARNFEIFFVVIAIAIAVWLSWVIVRSIVHPLNYAIKIAENVAAGDLSQKIENEHQDEIGQLLNALSSMVQTLSQIMAEIRASTEQITSAASEIATGNMDLSSRTEMQASSLEETASSMEEMTSTVKQNADNARQANQLSAAAADVAQKGGAMINQVVEVMGRINTSSQKISDIIGVIDGIAFQTNILALNAAVEAARAGEQGRGFAVVASEVRNLAQRSASAAKDIKDLIGESVAQVKEGTKVVDQSGENMAKIVTSIQHVSEVVSEISIASQEQSSGIDQINIAITQMDETTQQNAALVEEAAAAASSMDDQARALNALVEKFKLEDERGNTFRANANANANSSDRSRRRLN